MRSHAACGYAEGRHAQRHHPGRRFRITAAPADPRGQQAAPAHLRQADDLLPAVDADAGGDPGHPDHHDPARQDGFRRLLGDGSTFGSRSPMPSNHSPNGLAQAFIIGRRFVGSDRVALVLGDNVFYGAHFTDFAARRCGPHGRRNRVRLPGADPQRYGVVEFDAEGRAIASRKSPRNPGPPTR